MGAHAYAVTVAGMVACWPLLVDSGPTRTAQAASSLTPSATPAAAPPPCRATAARRSCEVCRCWV